MTGNHARVSLLPLLSRSGPAHAPATLDPITIATDEMELVGTVAPSGQRITDLLLRGQDLAFLPRGADPAPDAWISIAPDEILWVVPPPLPDRASALGAHADPVRVFVRIGDYRLVGSARVPSAIDHRLADRHAFLPLTSASIARDRSAGTARAEDVDVVIVNLARASEQRVIG